MSSTKRPSVYVFGTLAVALVGLLAATPAESRSPACNESLRESAKRVSELEAEVRVLRAQLRATTGCQGNAADQFARSAPPPKAPSVVLASNGHGRRGSVATESEFCDPPFSFDRHGIKFYNPECLGPPESAPCATPFGFTTSGIKYYEARCLTPVTSRRSCDPPFEIDVDGMKRYKSECL